MSSVSDSLPSPSPASRRDLADRTGLLPSTQIILGRLFWKDARQIFPVWLTLLFAAILCLLVAFLMINNGRAHIAPMFVSGHTFVALCSVITGVFLFASEDENRTLHFLRNLPVQPSLIVLQKLLLGGAGVIVLACVIAAFTSLLEIFVWSGPLGPVSSFRFGVIHVTLLPLSCFVVASIGAILSRSLFYGVLISGFITFLLIGFLEPTWLGEAESNHGERGLLNWLWVAMASFGGGCMMLINATRWIEEKAVTSLSQQARSPKTSLPQTFAKLSASPAPNPFPVLLWQSFRQSRLLLASCFMLTVVGWFAVELWIDVKFQQLQSHTTQAIISAFATLCVMLVSVGAFASSISIDDKRHNNFLFFQQNRERAKWLWLSRLTPFWCLAVLLVLLWNLVFFNVDGLDPAGLARDFYYYDRFDAVLESILLQATNLSFGVPFLAMLGMIGIGHYFSLFVRNPILSFVFSGLVSVVFVALLAYVVFVNESVLLFVLPVVVAIYGATWLRAKSWLATSYRKAGFMLPLALPLIALAITVPTFTHHRATEYADIEIDPNNLVFLSSVWAPEVDNYNYAITKIEFGDDAQRQKAAKLYQEAAASFREDYTWESTRQMLAWPAEQKKDFVTKHRDAISKVIEAAQIPVCDPFVLSDPGATTISDDWLLLDVFLLNSRHQLSEGNLVEAKLSIDARDRVLQRSQVRYSRQESGYYSFLVDWAEHPKQELHAIKSAIAQLEGSVSDIKPTKVTFINGAVVTHGSLPNLDVARRYREFGGERAFMQLQYEIGDLKSDSPNHELHNFKSPYRLMPWEYQRMLKVGQRWKQQSFNREQNNIGLLAQPNDMPIQKHQLARLFRNSTVPLISFDEDRTGGALYPYRYGNDVRDRCTWRRYTLLRLALAAYKIENDRHPDKLAELKPYFKNGFPKTCDGLSFGWLKEGLEADLVVGDFSPNSLANQAILGSVPYARVLYGSRPGLPLLLPFAIDQDKLLSNTVEYVDFKDEQVKFGIDVDTLKTHCQVFMPRGGIGWWSVGEAPSDE